MLPNHQGLQDTIGAFVVTADIDKDAFGRYKEDDYATIMIRILSDRLAEAAAEWFHEKIRREYWGYSAEEVLSIEELLKLKYKGIRPAPGYPACPDHTEKESSSPFWKQRKRLRSGLLKTLQWIRRLRCVRYVFSHPGSTYFNIGKIGTDQLKDYAERKNMNIKEASRWLAPNL